MREYRNRKNFLHVDESGTSLMNIRKRRYDTPSDSDLRMAVAVRVTEDTPIVVCTHLTYRLYERVARNQRAKAIESRGASVWLRLIAPLRA